MKQFFLDFYETATPQRVFISEVVGYDGFAYKVKQGANRWGRDKIIGGDEVPITFWKFTGEATDTPNINEYGQAVYFLDHAFERILEITKASRKGFCARILFGIIDNGVEFVYGELDAPNLKTDEYSYITVNVISDRAAKIVEMRNDRTADVFSTVDLDGNTVTPLAKTKFLLKAKPTYVNSTFVTQGDPASSVARVTDLLGGTGVHDGFQQISGVNNTKVPTVDNINNTLSFISDTYALDKVLINNQWMPLLGLNFTYIYTLEQLTNVTIDINNLIASTIQQKNDNQGDIIEGSGYARLVVHIGTDFDDPLLQTYELWRKDYGDTDFTPSEDLPQNHTLMIPLIEQGKRVFIFLDPYAEATFSENDGTLDNYVVSTSWTSATISITATATAIDSVIDSVPYQEYLKAGLLRISQLPLICPQFENGGKFQNLFCFNGNMIRNKKDKPLNFLFKDAFTDDLQFPFALDYQISSTEVELDDYAGYHPNIDLGGFFSVPAPTTIEKSTNDRFKINAFDVECQKYEKDDRVENTNENFQTKSNYILAFNKNVNNKKEFNLKFIWDADYIERIKTLGLRDTTAIEQDNELAIVDAIELAPGTFGGFTATLTHRILDGKVYLFNTFITGTGEAAPVSFTWTSVGVNVGAPFSFTIFGITVNHTIDSISDSVVVLNPVGYTPVFTGSASTIVSFPFTDVLWTQRTEEGFDQILNLPSGNKRANIRYSIGQQMQNWYQWLATAASTEDADVIRNILFINNGELTTQYNGGRVIKENANINVSDLGDKILSIDVYKTRIKCSLADFKALFETKLKGFIRIQNANGEIKKIHIDDCSFLERDEILEINKGSVRHENDDTTVNTGSGGFKVYIDGAGYVDGAWYRIANGQVMFYDSLNFQVKDAVDFTDVSINGTLHTDEILFEQALVALF